MGSASINSCERDDGDIYSRPKTPEPTSMSLMTTSCPPSAFLASEFASKRSVIDNDARTRGGRNDIYSNDSFGSPKHSSASVSTTTSTSLFNFTSMTSLPPRPPSFRLRSRENSSSTTSGSHHHPHYNHHFRDSGHASLGSSDDISSAPPLPPRLSCKLVRFIDSGSNSSLAQTLAEYPWRCSSHSKVLASSYCHSKIRTFEL